MLPSCRTLIEEGLPYMMICTFEKFVLAYVNVIIFITPTFDLWMNKGALDTFAIVIIFFNIGLGIKTCHNWSI
jgi:hypothetical protein